MSRRLCAVLLIAFTASAAAGLASDAWAQPAAPKAQAPVLVTSCGQSPGPLKLTVFLKKLGIEYDYKADATDKDLASKKYKTLIIVTGASLKGMGAAGVSMKDELARTAAIIDAAKKGGVLLIGSHIEGMARRSQGAEAGDNSDEQSIDAVCPRSQALLVRKDGDEDGRFTAIAKKQNIPLITFEKNLEIEGVLKTLFGR
ncbi:MAG: DUF6305 family protein [Vicinamibacterales bacterium]|jgi:hypothetical protein|nr:DUF6305 family protein [Vicinamibacterales bacterium]